MPSLDCTVLITLDCCLTAVGSSEPVAQGIYWFSCIELYIMFSIHAVASFSCF